ncbi:hypothetical protein J2Z48_002982 [Croceifilum oryzae]|uniref:Uncharacterized protein n=1 Tax=Croceifilum oryzae TaxID=1553429 RepID=A0AAJ1WTU2_9BACL|nr:hypothetical protein [Croceifilum oryzae]MDQ0418778.1 hypothetical protein [Croceifilum oryzae]
MPAWTDFGVVHLHDPFTLHSEIHKYKRRTLIDNINDTEWREQIRDNMSRCHSILFICYDQDDMYIVAQEIENQQTQFATNGPLS